MINRITSSLAFRLPKLYRFLLRYRKPKVDIVKPAMPLVILTMTGKAHIDMTRLTLLSISKNWDSLPKVIISSDGSMAVDRIKAELSFWPGDLHIESYEATAAYHHDLQRNALVAYGAAHPFGKKMAVILRHAADQPVLWIDSDILFFSDFTKYIPQDIKGFACGGTEDFMAAYDNKVLKYFNNDLYKKYHFNAGLLFASGADIYDQYNLEKLLASIHPDYDFLTEQSIFAHIASSSLGLIWSKDIVECYHTDNQNIKPMPVENVIARHYISTVRHLFWRDAFFRL